jgi:murein DD-endopeptidase MepM/ murein hydrolase activator NlpD
MHAVLRRYGPVFLMSLLWSCCLAPGLRAEETAAPVIPEASRGALRHGTLATIDTGGQFVPAPTPGQATHLHPGVDLVAPCGTPVYAAASGRVVDAISSAADPDFAFLGYMVRIQHAATGSDQPHPQQLREVQRRLHQAGFDAGPIDGLLGRRTRAALHDYQAYRGLPVTGKPDAATLTALGVTTPETDTGGGLYSLYLYLQGPPPVAVGQRVSGGRTVIGRVGSSGVAQACYTHFEMRRFPTRYLPDRTWNDPRSIYGRNSQHAAQLLRQYWVDPEAYLGRPAPAAGASAAFPGAGAANATTARLTLRDGRALVGQIQHGALEVESSLDTVTVDAATIASLGHDSMTLRDGSVITGRPVGGHLTVDTAYGSFTLPAHQIDTIVVTSARASAVPEAAPKPPAHLQHRTTRGDAGQPRPRSDTRVARAYPELVRLRVLNDTDQILHVYIDGSQDYVRLRPRQVLSRELAAGQHHIKATAVLELGPVLMPLGSFDSSVHIRDDAIIRISSSDLLR